MDIPVKLLQGVPASLILGVFGLAVLLVLLVPLALKLAGLTGQQIVDVLTLTMQFFVNLVREFRAENRKP